MHNASQFERLKQATGLELDFSDDARDGKVDLDTTPIDNMMGRYAAQAADCSSLERFLDSTTQQVNVLELELTRLQKARLLQQQREVEAARGSGKRSHSPSRKQMDSELDEVTRMCEDLEAKLRGCFPPTVSILKALVAPADFAAAVREAEAIRKRKFLEEGVSGQSFTDTVVSEKQVELNDDGIVAKEGSAIGSKNTKPSGKSMPLHGAAGVLASPSGVLQSVLTELQQPHNANRTRMLDGALVKVEHELLAVHDATRNFRPILDYLAHPHKSSADRLPGALRAWAGNPGDLEAKSVHAEFRRLAAESEKKQREEAMREDAAAEDAKSKSGRTSPSRSGGALSPSKSAAAVSEVPTLEASTGSISMPALAAA